MNVFYGTITVYGHGACIKRGALRGLYYNEEIGWSKFAVTLSTRT